MKLIELSKQGKNKGKYFAMVDDEDFDRVNSLKWRVEFERGNIYAVKRVEGKKLRMHRFILMVKDSKILVDHKDHNGLNNQKSNIRKCNSSQNSTNRTALGTSKYLGVSFRARKRKTVVYERWIAAIVIKGRDKCLGSFKNEIDAAMAYNKAAKQYHGEFANLNEIK